MYDMMHTKGKTKKNENKSHTTWSTQLKSSGWAKKFGGKRKLTVKNKKKTYHAGRNRGEKRTILDSLAGLHKYQAVVGFFHVLFILFRFW
jgi:hypothetical protein